MIKKIFIFILVLVAGVIIFASTKPDTFRVQRQISIKAPAEKIFALINDFHKAEQWSPWEKIDPAIKRTYSGPENGVGAKYQWNGNSEVGQGSMEIVESTSSTKVRMKIDFITPFEGHSTVEFTLVPQGDSIILTQAMFGPNSLISKVMSLVFDCDKMIGEKYEEGLASIKVVAEK